MNKVQEARLEFLKGKVDFIISNGGFGCCARDSCFNALDVELIRDYCESMGAEPYIAGCTTPKCKNHEVEHLCLFLRSNGRKIKETKKEKKEEPEEDIWGPPPQASWIKVWVNKILYWLNKGR